MAVINECVPLSETICQRVTASRSIPFAFGWALMVPVVTLLVLDLHPERRGMASSLQAFIGSTANGLVAGLIAPLVMHSALALAGASLLMLCVGLLAWVYLHKRWPEIGRRIEH